MMTRFLNFMSLVFVAALAGCGHSPAWMPVNQETHAYTFDWNGRTSNIMGTEFPREIDHEYAFLACDHQVLEDTESRFVIGFRASTTGVALIVAFDRPEDARLTWDVSTDSGTMEAWLYRRVFNYSRSFQHVEEFWAQSPAERAEDEHAIELVGSARIRFAHGRLYRVDVDVESVDPVPLYAEFLDDHRPTYDNDENYWRRRAREARMKATIKGRFLGYWYNWNWRFPLM